jgi:hypothetical protein
MLKQVTTEEEKLEDYHSDYSNWVRINEQLVLFDTESAGKNLPDRHSE